MFSESAIKVVHSQEATVPSWHARGQTFLVVLPSFVLQCFRCHGSSPRCFVTDAAAMPPAAAVGRLPITPVVALSCPCPCRRIPPPNRSASLPDTKSFSNRSPSLPLSAVVTVGSFRSVIVGGPPPSQLDLKVACFKPTLFFWGIIGRRSTCFVWRLSLPA